MFPKAVLLPDVVPPSDFLSRPAMARRTDRFATPRGMQVSPHVVREGGAREKSPL